MERVDKDSNQAFYDSQRMDDRRRFEEEPSKVHLTEALVPWVASHVSAGARILDVAGGSGVYASGIVRAAPVAVVGLDISRSMVAQRTEDPLLPENVVGDMEALPFPDGSFDAVLFAMCLHHLPDPGTALGEAYRVLRAGGALFAAEPSSLRAGRGGIAPVPETPHEFRFTLRFLTAQIKSAGFRVERVTGKRLSVRFTWRVTRSQTLGALRAGDRVDRVLDVLPGLTRLAEIVLVHAVKPGEAEARAETTGSLVCPACRGSLSEAADRLSCSSCGAAYPLENGIPVLLTVR